MTNKMAEAYKIDKLTNENYTTWRIKIMAVCLARGTWEALSTPAKRPIVDSIKGTVRCCDN